MNAFSNEIISKFVFTDHTQIMGFLVILVRPLKEDQLFVAIRMASGW